MRHLPQQGLDQRAFTTAVRADQRMHTAGADVETDVIENRRLAQGQRDLIELNPGAGGEGDQRFGSAHAPASCMALTTVLRLPVISFSYLSAL